MAIKFLLLLEKNKDFREEIIKRGKARAKMFNWARCSKIIKDTLIQVAKKRKVNKSKSKKLSHLKLNFKTEWGKTSLFPREF